MRPIVPGFSEAEIFARIRPRRRCLSNFGYCEEFREKASESVEVLTLGGA